MPPSQNSAVALEGVPPETTSHISPSLYFIIHPPKSEFGGPAEVKRGDTRRNGTQTKVLYRRYKLFSDVQRADDIEVVIDGAAGQKQFAYMEPVKLKNPSVTAEGYVINGRAFVDYILHAEDMEKA